MTDFRARFPQTAKAIDSGLDAGLHIGTQLYISVNAEPVADVALGMAGNGIEMTGETVMPWLSAGKPLAAVAAAILRESGKLDWADPVAKFIPEFGRLGKEPVTIEQLLTHTGGFRWADFSFTMPWDEIIGRICAAPLEPRWIPGKTAWYHPITSWYILGELVRRLDSQNRPYDKFVREEIFLPLGMDDCWLAMPPDIFARYGRRMGGLEPTGTSHPRPVPSTSPQNAHLCIPGASARGPMRQLGRFYEMLLNSLGGAADEQNPAGARPIISTESVKALVSRRRIGLYDLTFKHIVDWGLGFIVNSAQYGEATVPYGFGPAASAETFGHGGSQSSLGMADPRFSLVVAVVFNGMPGEVAHQKRIRSVAGAIYDDLQFPGGLPASGGMP
jgi:CubicO group peptidase (beta-lactamase class C family)